MGTVTASQISRGRENDLFIEIDGTKGAIAWRQEEPNQMIVRRNGEPHKIDTRDPNAPFMNASGGASPSRPSSSILPPPEDPRMLTKTTDVPRMNKGCEDVWAAGSPFTLSHSHRGSIGGLSVVFANIRGHRLLP